MLGIPKRARVIALATDSIWPLNMGVRMPRAFLGLWLQAWFHWVPLSGADVAAEVTFTNASVISHLSPEESGRSHPVRLTGAVAYSDPGWGLLFIRDASGGVFVSLANKVFPTNTELVEIIGRTGSGSFLSVVTEATWRHVGLPGPMS